LRYSIIWLGCILLMISGIVFGICINSNSGMLDSIYKFIGSIASFSTIIMASIAAIALTTWKEQFYHNKQYDHLTELESIARSAISHLEAYITSNKELKVGSNSIYLEETEHYKNLKS
jgi:hypothetical protein